jgi:hypothetical protein
LVVGLSSSCAAVPSSSPCVCYACPLAVPLAWAWAASTALSPEAWSHVYTHSQHPSLPPSAAALCRPSDTPCHAVCCSAIDTVQKATPAVFWQPAPPASSSMERLPPMHRHSAHGHSASRSRGAEGGIVRRCCCHAAQRRYFAVFSAQSVVPCWCRWWWWWWWWCAAAAAAAAAVAAAAALSDHDSRLSQPLPARTRTVGGAVGHQGVYSC